MENENYKFINESLFFPERGILVIGDLHIGYDVMLRQSGVLIPERQIEDVMERLDKIFQKIDSKNYELKKIIFLGDIKHSFSFDFQERKDFDQIMDFLRQKFSEENIILIKGNHDTIDYSLKGKMKSFHIEDEIAFLHGHKLFLEVFNKNIDLIVMGHLHPSVVLQENPGIKKENYKCFLTGGFRGKKVIVLPSFLGIIEGSKVNEYSNKLEKDFSIIPKKDLLEFRVHVVGKDKTYSFGKVNDFD